MAHIRDMVSPVIVPHSLFVKASNESAYLKTDKGRELTPHQIALVRIAQLEERLSELEAKLK